MSTARGCIITLKIRVWNALAKYSRLIAVLVDGETEISKRAIKTCRRFPIKRVFVLVYSERDFRGEFQVEVWISKRR